MAKYRYKSGLNFHFLLILLIVLIPLFTIIYIVSQELSIQPIQAAPSMGAVLSTSPMTLPSQLQSIATGVRVTYESSDVNGTPIVVTSAIITPNTLPAHPNVVAYAHGTTGIAPQCAPSSNLNVFWPEAVDAIQSYLQQGYVVAATDYQGLGYSNSGTHQYLIGSTEARNVIDSVKAAVSLNSNLTGSYVIVGHSQGGQASLFAGQIAGSYGQGVTLKGVVAVAPASHEEILATQIAGTPNQGYLIIGLQGLAAADPKVNVDSLLSQQAIKLEPVTKTGCLEEILTAYQNLNSNQTLHSGELPKSIIAEVSKYGDPAQTASTVPVMLVQGTADTTVPPQFTADVQTKICSYGVPVDLQYVQGADHDQSLIQSTGIVGTYISGLFSGQTPVSNCQ